ncbi:spore germination protein [Sutcliffiella rhizosphaerae]|uniref:Spore germination protein A1 n=1 Tax=Sutcliffiella rhizosphaerae TaxID=2880967 RepID=A0ABN8ADC4_9BACI|nr:spore germination protein [Sutcliffiella rhizosphaerae]CAG9621996.1 Spore germination protein A1 [Sutcliffiella rhizosphaerae]
MKKENVPHYDLEEMKTYFQEAFHHSPDLYFYELNQEKRKFLFIYLKNLVDYNVINQSIMPAIIDSPVEHLLGSDEFSGNLPTTQVSPVTNREDAIQYILDGYLYITSDQTSTGVLINVSKKVERGLEKAETESLVFGPKISFTESLSTNISIIRQNILSTNLCTEKLTVGTKNETEIRIVYLNDLADKQAVEDIKKKISTLKVNDILDTSVLAQLIDDNSYSIFPQFVQTELPDRVTYSVERGMVAVFVDRSPMVLLGPASFFNFFESTEDVYMRWNMGSFIRFLRYMTIFLSIILTPAYVAIITYHYEMIPSTLLVSLGESRSKVPFTPIFEALILEIMIELLREAGARLPTKVGQTMGIVGGIVLGQAAVEAGFTSNILIIVVALSALGSFTAPSYLMGTAVRITRFPMLILAGLYGGIGIALGLCFLLIHLIRLTSVGKPYLQPVYPFNFHHALNTIVRVPTGLLRKNTNKQNFFSSRQVPTKDIDE